jgi:hypothetical protein
MMIVEGGLWLGGGLDLDLDLDGVGSRRRCGQGHGESRQVIGGGGSGCEIGSGLSVLMDVLNSIFVLPLLSFGLCVEDVA